MEDQSDGDKDKAKLVKVKNFMKQEKLQLMSNGQDVKNIDVPNRLNFNRQEINSQKNGIMKVNGSSNAGPTMKGNIGPMVKKNEMNGTG